MGWVGSRNRLHCISRSSMKNEEKDGFTTTTTSRTQTHTTRGRGSVTADYVTKLADLRSIGRTVGQSATGGDNMQ